MVNDYRFEFGDGKSWDQCGNYLKGVPAGETVRVVLLAQEDDGKQFNYEGAAGVCLRAAGRTTSEHVRCSFEGDRPTLDLILD